MRCVGVLASSTRANEEVIPKPCFDEMRRLGWIEGQTIAYDRAYADDRHQDLARLAGELVARKPELICAPSQVAAMAAREATGTIPIVPGSGTDPVGPGLVASLARPGGNATGVVNVVESLAPKRLELLREMLPGVKRVGLLSDPTEPLSTADHTKRMLAASAWPDGRRGSGSRTQSPAPGPLRTVHASFNAHGSSLYKGILRHPVTQPRVRRNAEFYGN